MHEEKVLESTPVCLGHLLKTAKGGQARSVDEKQKSLAEGMKSCQYSDLPRHDWKDTIHH